MSGLTGIELDVLRGAAAGETYAETARRVFITEKSVSNVATRIMRKLDAKSMPHAVLLACRAGILDGRPQRHGDHAGFAAHRYRGEEPCGVCWAGEREYRAELRRRRRQKGPGGRQAASDGSGGAREGRDAVSPPESPSQAAA